MSGRKRRVPLGILLVLVAVSCSSDSTTGPDTGILSIRARLPQGAPGEVPAPDSLRAIVRDEDGIQLAAASAAFPDTNEAILDLVLSPGDRRSVLVQADRVEGGDRTGLYVGADQGLSISKGGTTGSEILLDRAFPPAPSVEGEPGAHEVHVSWRSVPHATGYLLWERNDTGIRSWPVSDTARLVPVFEPRGSAGLGAAAVRSSGPAVTRRAYRVRAELPFGPGAFSDSTAVDLDAWIDLPRVVSVDPPPGSEEISDRGEVLVAFDRPMDPVTLADTLVALRDDATGAEIPCQRIVGGDDTEVRLIPEDPLERGSWVRVRVSTKVVGADGRPLDQDPQAEGLQAFASTFRVEEYDPIRVLAVEPAPGIDGVAVEASIRAELSKEVDPSSLTQEVFLVRDSAGVVPGTRRVLQDGRTIELRPSRPLLFDVVHEIEVTEALRDAERGEPLDQDPQEPGFQRFLSSFRTALQPRGPRVVWSVPLPGEPHHPVWVKPEVEFDRAIDPATVTFDRGLFLRIILFGNEFNVSGAWQPSPDSLRFTFRSGIPLERDGSYRLLAVGGPGGVRDADGVPLDQDAFTPGYQSFQAPFRAEQNVRATSSVPADGAVDVSWETDVVVRFSMPVQPESLVDTTLILRRGGVPVPAERTVGPDSLSATLAPLDPLASYTEYELFIGTGIRSRRGGPFDQNWTLEGHQDHTIRFRTLPETEAPRVLSVEPIDRATGIVLDAAVRVVFSEPVRPIRVLEYMYVTRGDSLGARVPGELVVSSDSLSATFTPDGELETITTYHVHVDTWVTDPFGNRLDQDPDEPGWQKHHSVFTTRNEQIPPAVETIDPEDGEIGVSITPVVRIVFTESMDRETLPGAIRVDASGAAVEGTLAYEDADRTVLWNPSHPLHYERTYRVLVDTLAADLAGNLLDQYPGTPRRDPVESFFTTAVDTLPPRLVSVEPEDGATGVDVETVPSVSFTEPIDPATITAASVALNDSTGLSIPSERELIAEGTTVRIVPDEPFAFDRLYRILVTTSLTDTNGVPFDADSLLDGNQATSSSFRTQLETIGPQVVDLLLDGEPEPGVDTRVRIVFDEPIREETVGPQTFRLIRGEEDVEGSRSVSAAGDTATFVPDAPLDYATEHRVFVSEIEDLVGNPLDQQPQEPGQQPFEATFTTGPDRDPPRVVRSQPADGEAGVPPDTPLRLVFAEPMDTTTFSSADPGLFRDGVWVPAIRTAEPGDTAFAFVPDSSLRRGSVYEWRAGTLLEDLAGNALDQDPGAPGRQGFQAFFEVGDRPIADAGPGVCSVGGSAEVWVDARGSFDPDGDLAWAVWRWGDGAVDSLVAPEGLLAVHSYACVDGAGCDGVDNDGDGETDEEGADGCDESHRIVLQVVDADGFVAADTTGVSFCAFLVDRSEPPDGAGEVDTLATPSIWLTRAVDPESVDSTAVWLALETDPETVWPESLSVGEEGRRVHFHPRVPLLADTTYVLRADSSLRSAAGDSLDEEPCEPGFQGYEARFRTVAPAEPGPPRYRLPHDRRDDEGP